MNKSVLISIQPYWVFLIIAKTIGWNCGQEKTIEVRKCFPKDKNWNKNVKIYCTKDRKSFNRIPKEYQPLMQKFLGKVIGEFVCNEIESDDLYQTQFYQNNWMNSCLTQDELITYGKGERLYGWHISNLKIYDKPKELSEFYKCGFSTTEELEDDLCNYCSATDYGEHKGYGTPNGYVSCEGRFCDKAYQKYLDDNFLITRPPQSWCYVEELEL